MSTIVQGLSLFGAVCLGIVVLIWLALLADEWRRRRRARKSRVLYLWDARASKPDSRSSIELHKRLIGRAR